MKKIITILILVLLAFGCSKDLDDNLIDTFNNQNSAIELLPENEIPKGSELFSYLQQIATDDPEPNQNITCINFRYPLTIFVFDALDDFESLNVVINDDDFSQLLNGLSDQHSISVSFPIETTLESGEEFSITSKEDLKIAIDNCLSEERVGECSNLLEQCKFRVGYNFNGENSYLGAIFEEANGFTTFDFNNETSIGSWTALTIEEELHININLVDADQDTSEFFNHNWLVEYIDDNSLKLTYEDREITLHQRCNLDNDLCSSFVFEKCENETGMYVADFYLNDYLPCIFEFLEFNNEFIASFFESSEDAETNNNPISGTEVFNNTSSLQSIYVKITDPETMTDYIVEILLNTISC